MELFLARALPPIPEDRGGVGGFGSEVAAGGAFVLEEAIGFEFCFIVAGVNAPYVTMSIPVNSEISLRTV
jgi:hypothetical protein